MPGHCGTVVEHSLSWGLERCHGSTVKFSHILAEPERKDTNYLVALIPVPPMILDPSWEPYGVFCLGPTKNGWGWQHVEAHTMDVIKNSLTEMLTLGRISENQWVLMEIIYEPDPD